MGKRLQGAALRSKKRQKILRDELQEHQAEQVALQSVVDQPDQALFALDTTGQHVPPNQRPPPPQKKKKKKKETKWSEREQDEINKLVQRHSKEELTVMVQNGLRLFDKTNHLRTHGIRKATSTNSSSKSLDLWSDDKDDDLVIEESRIGGMNTGETTFTNTTKDDSNNSSNKSTKKGKLRTFPTAPQPVKGVAVGIAKGGQSYRPDPREHQKVLQEAMTVEERRIQAEAEKNAPISPGMSEATKALLLGDSDSSSSDDDEDDDNDENNESDGGENNNKSDRGENDKSARNDRSRTQKDENCNIVEKANVTSSSMTFQKVNGKLTKSQRNKQKRLRHAEREKRQIKHGRQSEHQLFQIARLRKEVKQQEEQEKQRQAEKTKRLAKAAAHVVMTGGNIETEVSQKDPVAAPTYPVALTCEVSHQHSSLRTMIPKGSLVTDRMASYALRSLAAKLPSHAAASAAKKLRRGRPRKKVKGAKDWQGDNFVIIK